MFDGASYEIKLAVTANQTRDLGLNCQCSIYTELNNYQPSQSSICTAQVLNASVAHLTATQCLMHLVLPIQQVGFSCGIFPP